MCWASLNMEPDELVLCTRSEPAKSTKCNLDLRITSDPASLDSTNTVKIQCDRDEAIFMGVSAMARFVSPRNNKFNASSMNRVAL